MAKVLRAGVIGAGVFGGYHANQYAALEGVELAGVYDHHPAHAEAIVARLGGQVFASEAELIAAVDVVSIGDASERARGLSPGRARRRQADLAWRNRSPRRLSRLMQSCSRQRRARATIASAAQASWRPVSPHRPACWRRRQAGLCGEVPVATTPEEADWNRGPGAAAMAWKAVCGFLERAGMAAMGLFGIPEAPTLLEAVRVGTPGARNLDVSVVLDLMIHDLDLALALSAAEPMTVEADGSCVANRLLDVVEAEADFEDGFICRFRASRVAEARERTMRAWKLDPSGEVRVDLDLTHAFTNTTPYELDPNFEATPAGRNKLGATIARSSRRCAARSRRHCPASALDGACFAPGPGAAAVEQAMAQQGLV